VISLGPCERLHPHLLLTAIETLCGVVHSQRLQNIFAILFSGFRHKQCGKDFAEDPATLFPAWMNCKAIWGYISNAKSLCSLSDCLMFAMIP
jgi:hypothetical protein